MGGTGSGKWARHSTKATVQECSCLDTAVFRQAGCLAIGSAGTVFWNNHPPFKADFAVTASKGGARHLRITFSLNRTKRQLSIRLQTTVPHFGGTRFWFTCPVGTNGMPCGRRVRKLYFYACNFGCRICQQLAYESCRESRIFHRLMRNLIGCAFTVRQWTDECNKVSRGASPKKRRTRKGGRR